MSVFLVAALAVSAMATRSQQRAQQVQQKAEKEARKVEQRIASIENQRNKRRAIAQQQVSQAQITNQAAADNQSGSSAVRGAVTASQAGLGGSIGFSNNQLGAANAKGNILQQGANSSTAFQNNAAVAGVVSKGFGLAYNKYGVPQ